MNTNKNKEKLKIEFTNSLEKITLNFIKNLKLNMNNNKGKDSLDFLIVIIFLFYSSKKKLNDWLKSQYLIKKSFISTFLFKENFFFNKIKTFSSKINEIDNKKVILCYKNFINLKKEQNETKILVEYLNSLFSYFNILNDSILFINKEKVSNRDIKKNRNKDNNSILKSSKRIINLNNKDNKIINKNDKKIVNKKEVFKKIESKNLKFFNQKNFNKNRNVIDKNLKEKQNIKTDLSNKNIKPNIKEVTDQKKEENINKSKRKVNNTFKSNAVKNNLSISKGKVNNTLKSTAVNNNLSKSKRNIDKSFDKSLLKNSNLNKSLATNKDKSIIKSVKNDKNDIIKEDSKEKDTIFEENIINLDDKKEKNTINYIEKNKSANMKKKPKRIIYNSLNKQDKVISPKKQINKNKIVSYYKNNKIKKFDKLKEEIKSKYKDIYFKNKKKEETKKKYKTKIENTKTYSLKLNNDEMGKLKKEFIDLKVNNNRLKFELEKQDKNKIKKEEKIKKQTELDYQLNLENKNLLYFNENFCDKFNKKLINKQWEYKSKKYKTLEKYLNKKRYDNNDFVQINKIMRNENKTQIDNNIENKIKNIRDIKSIIKNQLNVNKTLDNKLNEKEKKFKYDFEKNQISKKIDELKDEFNFLNNIKRNYIN